MLPTSSFSLSFGISITVAIVIWVQLYMPDALPAETLPMYARLGPALVIGKQWWTFLSSSVYRLELSRLSVSIQ